MAARRDRELSPELAREFRGLRLWLPIKMHGIEPFRQNLEEKLELAAWITRQLRARDDVEIIAEPQLSLLVSGPTKGSWRGTSPGVVSARSRPARRNGLP